MDYLLGTVATILVFYISKKVFYFQVMKNRLSFSNPNTQSYIHALLLESGGFSDSSYADPFSLNTQAVRHFENSGTRILYLEDSAYWIQDSYLHAGKLSSEGFVIEESVQKVDTMSMDKVQLELTSFIVSKLTEGQNDRGNTGKS